MNYYPFVSDNLSGANGSYRWDVVFLPELISKPYTLDFAMLGTHYNDTSNNDWVNGGTINYHLSNNGIATPCNPGTSKPYFPNSQYDLFAYSSYNTYNFRAEYDFSHGHPGPFSLYTTYLRNSTGTSLAGYLLNSGLLTIQTSDIGIKHKYFIDKGFPFFDLSVINPTEKIIYNPSEVTVIADVISSAITEIVFPTGYTFKTILGRYPSTYEVNDANTIENGGPYSDPRDVPVPVNAADLVAPGGNLNYPEVSWDDPSTWLLDERYGYYYMENNGKITVEPCVRIFDAIFESKQGGTLIFEEYPSVKNPARFKTITDGGAVLKNYAAIQYVQNGIITQPYPLIYIAQNKIYAGKQVDPDATALVGSYTVESGANVTFRATETVYLKNGFHAKNGSAFRAHCPNITYTPCNATFAVSGSRMASNNTETLKSHSNLSVMQEMVVSPNPGNGVFEIKLSDSKTNYHLSVTDIYGRMIVENNSKVGVQNLDLRNQPAGIYFVTAITPSKKLIEKIIKQ